MCKYDMVPFDEVIYGDGKTGLENYLVNTVSVYSEEKFPRPIAIVEYGQCFSWQYEIVVEIDAVRVAKNCEYNSCHGI